MLWVIVFAAIAVAGLVMVGCYAVWLAHKAADVMSEVTVLADLGARLTGLIGQIEVPGAHWQPDQARDLTTAVVVGDSPDVHVR